MSTPRVTTHTEEPIGIVISRGSRDEPTPAFASYEWGPALEEPEPADHPARA
jgi:hypothetical protein